MHLLNKLRVVSPRQLCQCVLTGILAGDGHPFDCEKRPTARVCFRFAIDGYIWQPTIRQANEDQDCGVNSDDDQRRGYQELY
jgi:hypothetical protein